MGRKNHGKFVRADNKGKDKRHKMKGKTLESFTEEMHSAFQGNYIGEMCYLFTDASSQYFTYN